MSTELKREEKQFEGEDGRLKGDGERKRKVGGGVEK